MPLVTVHLVHAFTDSGEGGNPAGVVLEVPLRPGRTPGFVASSSASLSHDQKQRVAAAVGSSETAFLSPSQAADYKLEFFTPTRQIAHCGHATIAAFSFLVQQGLLSTAESSKETIDGTRRIFLEGDRAFMEQTAPRFTPLAPEDLRLALASLCIDEPVLMPGRLPVLVNTGNSFLVVPMKDQASLASLVPDLPLVERISEKFDLVGYYPFTLQAQVTGRDAAARMFAPRYGITEESATGMAAGTLGAYLYEQLGMKKDEFVLEQGRLMPQPSPSEIIVKMEAEEGRITRILVGGRASVRGNLEIEI